MNFEQGRKYFLVGLLLLLLFATYLVIKPYYAYAILALVLAAAFYPMYAWIRQRVESRPASSVFTLIVITLIIIVPSYFALKAVVNQSFGIISSLNDDSISSLNEAIEKATGLHPELETRLPAMVATLRSYLLSYSWNIASTLLDATIGIMIMYCLMYYALIQGGDWISKIKKMLPLERKQSEMLFHKIDEVTRAVIYGQVMVSLLLGVLGGIGFAIAGIKNYVFWGFVMAILAILPLVGTGLVWVPAVIILLASGKAIAGIFLLIYGMIFLVGLNYIITPWVISGKAQTHPLIVIIGIFGGIKAFGFVGILLGPLIAALFFTIVEFYHSSIKA